MKCPDCGAGLRVSREPHKYTLHPKWAITIADAEIRRCPQCGYFEVVIPRPEALHRTIAAEVIRKPARLSGPEFAFLRSELGMSGRGYEVKRDLIDQLTVRRPAGKTACCRCLPRSIG